MQLHTIKKLFNHSITTTFQNQTHTTVWESSTL